MTTQNIKWPSISEIDLDKELGIAKPYTPSPAPPSLIASSPKTSKLFIKGPIPFEWLQNANALGGSTGIVAMGLWFYVGLNQSKRFKIDSKLDAFTGITRQSRQHALSKLQYAGLIRYQNHHGAYPTVMVIA
jgi:hypothetical protein